MPNGTRVQTIDAGARGQNPFAEHLRYQDEQIVLAATGGKLTALAESGTGTLAGSAHQNAFDDITEAEAVVLSEVFQRQFDAPLLAQEFPGQPQLAYFELALVREIDPATAVAHALTLAKAGYEIDPSELSEKTGYTLKLRDYPLPQTVTPPAPNFPASEAEPVEEEI
jgi:phage gp29-like protein